MSAAPKLTPGHGQSFFRSVLWSWLGMLVGLVSGVFLSPYVIHHIGNERYGIWALVFSLVDYYMLVDFGFKSAVSKYAAHYRATGEADKLDSLISTGLVYFSLAAALVACAAVALAQYSARIFHVSPQDAPALQFLTITVGVGCAAGVVFGSLTAVLEAHQRFDITSRATIVSNGVRVFGCGVVIAFGLGLKSMGICVLAGQLIAYIVTYRGIREILPGRSFGRSKASLAMLRQMLRYGVHTFLANMSLNVLNQNALILIGHFLAPAFVGFYSYPMRLLNYAVELVSRLGLVTTSKASELTAYGDMKPISRMAVLVNRYCLMLFLPFAVYLVIFGRQLLHVWVNPEFAINSAPLLPILGAGVIIAIAAQYNSTAILYSLAKHAAFARAVFVEALLSVLGLWYVIPRYGLVSAACVVSGLMILSRGLYVPYCVSRYLGMGLMKYFLDIYSRPVLIMTPITLVAWAINRALGEPATWLVALSSGAAIAAVSYAAALLIGIEPGHRAMLLNSLPASIKRPMPKRLFL